MMNDVEETGTGGTARREILLSVGAFVLFVLVTVGALLFFGSPGGTRGIPRAMGPGAKVATEITLLHTNDTWGYLYPCG